jgi:hypothetical protein
MSANGAVDVGGCSATEDGLHATLQCSSQLRETFAIVEIADVANVAQVERDVLFALCNQNNVSSEGVRDARFIKDIWISA